MLKIKKIIATIVLFIVLLSASTIYASGLPQNTLSKWYGQTFEKESEKFEEATSTGVLEVLNEVKDFLTDSKENFTVVISNFLDDQVSGVSSSVEEESRDLKNRLDESVAELEKVSFDEYVDKAEIEEAVRQDIEEILADVLSD